uniref:Ferritin/DPS protein domain-containing protein n=1 Tax=viral metagenome TaxID=1070528 RepID=A0A6C0KUT3_9ZZZZ
MEGIVQSFLQYQIAFKIYHWQTNSYSRHKASDELFSALSEKIDRFVECLQGSRNEKVKFKKGTVIELENFTDKEAVTLLHDFKNWLNKTLIKEIHEKDLINLRDDILADVHQALYLFTLV